MNASAWLLACGRFFFRHRNLVFPVVVLLLCVALPTAPSRIAAMWAGIGMMVLGLAWRAAVIGHAYIRRGGVGGQVHADELVSSGFFAMSRNPLYLGNFALYAGLFLVHGNTLVVVAGTAFFCFAYRAIVAAEEHYLDARFAQRYAAYRAAVPRWLPDLSRGRAALADLGFSWKRAVAKDYSTICSASLALLFVLGLRIGQDAGWSQARASLADLVLAGLAVLLLAVLTRTAKKSGWLRE